VLGSESSVARTPEHDAWRRTRGGAPSAVIVGIDLSGRNCQNYQQLLVLNATMTQACQAHQDIESREVERPTLRPDVESFVEIFV